MSEKIEERNLPVIVPTGDDFVRIVTDGGKSANCPVSALPGGGGGGGGSGTVTAVAMTLPTGLQVAGSPITTSGTFDVTYAPGYRGFTSAEGVKIANLGTVANLSYPGGTALFLRADGTFAAPPGGGGGSGTVTSVSITVPTGMVATGSPVTTSGTIALSYASGYQGFTATEAGKIAALGTVANLSYPGGTTQFLRADGTFAVPPSGGGGIPDAPVDGVLYGRKDASWQVIPSGGPGTVTSIAVTVPTGLAVSGSPITTSGTVAISYASGYQGYTTAESSKLAGIAAGAQVNVQPDWAATSGGGQILNKPVGTPMVEITAATATLTAAAHAGKWLKLNSASAQTITIGTDAASAWATDTEIQWHQHGVGIPTFVGASGVTILKHSSITNTGLGRYAPGGLKRVGANEWLLFGMMGST